MCKLTFSPVNMATTVRSSASTVDCYHLYCVLSGRCQSREGGLSNTTNIHCPLLYSIPHETECVPRDDPITIETVNPSPLDSNASGCNSPTCNWCGITRGSCLYAVKNHV